MRFLILFLFCTLCHADDSKQERITAWIVDKYHVDMILTREIVSIAYQKGEEIGIDPLLILAVIKVESTFNPFAHTHAGAKGLMQVLSKTHRAKFAQWGGERVAYDLNTNVHVGTTILKEYIDKTGSTKNGLKMYCGSALRKNDDGYTNKVMREYKLLGEL